MTNHTEESLMELAQACTVAAAKSPYLGESHYIEAANALRLAIREVLKEQDDAYETITALKQAHRATGERAERAEQELALAGDIVEEARRNEVRAERERDEWEKRAGQYIDKRDKLRELLKHARQFLPDEVISIEHRREDDYADNLADLIDAELNGSQR